MRIAICDNDKRFQKQLKLLISQYFEEKGIPLRMKCFDDASQMAAAAPDWDILFTDVCMPRSNVIDAVKQLRSHKDFPVVFITESREHAVDAFEVAALHYLLKPVSPGAITEAMNRCLSALNMLNEPVLYAKTTTPRQITPIVISRIVYIEVFNNLSVIHTASSQFQTYTPLKSLFEMLDESTFMKPHRSYIVNMNHIREFYFDRIVLDTGTEIVLSRQKRSILKQQYQNFLFTQTQSGFVS